MKFLIDTNIFIPLEPASLSGITALSPAAAQFIKIVQQSGHQIYLHPDQKYDIERDSEQDRRRMRKFVFEKYPVLQSPPRILHDLSFAIGNPEEGSNDWVDNQLIIALHRDAVHYLVTEDRKLRNKAVRISPHLSQRVLNLSEALRFVQVLFDQLPEPPPAVKSVTAFDLDETDPFFDSFKSDYKVFEAWLRKCRLEHRKAWIIDGQTNRYAAVAIVNPENKNLVEIEGRKLKICSFKVASENYRYYFGELLLKTIFQYAISNRYDYLYITVYPKYESLTNLLEEFGFQNIGQISQTGEIKFLKQLVYTVTNYTEDASYEFYYKHGPYSFKILPASIYVVPIQPEFHSILFPDSELHLFPGIHPFGNSIKKAYISNAPIRQLQPGDVLVFYQSSPYQQLTNIGIVEDTLSSDNADEVSLFVARRTVYSYDEIIEKCKSNALAILFSHAGILNIPIPFADLQSYGILTQPPQTIHHLSKGDLNWLLEEIKKRLPFYQSALNL